MPEIDTKYISTTEAAKMLNLHPAHVRLMVRRNRWPGKKFGRNYVMDIEDVVRLKREREAK